MAVSLRAIVYTRVSGAAQEQDGTSLDTQADRCLAYAEERGWQVVAVEREVHTGADLFGRPRLTAVREMLRDSRADVLLAYALDRLSRKQTHVAIIAEEAEAAGATLAFVTEDFDKGPVGTFIRGAKAFAAELEREKIRERSLRGREHRVRTGRPLPSWKPLYGYTWADETRSKLEEDPLTAPIVRRIFAEAIAGQTIRSIARGLSADVVPTPTGRADIWRTATVWKILRNPAYAGQMFGLRTRTERVCGRRRDVTVPAEEWVALPEGTVPALVDAETFASIAARLAANQAQATRNNKHPEDALLRGGFSRCGYCGNNLVAIRVKGEAHPQYRCNTPNRDRHGCPYFGISAGLLDAAVWAKVRATVLDRTLIEREVERMYTHDPTRADIAAIDRRLSEIDRQRGNLTRRLALFDDDEAAAPLVAEIGMLTEGRRQLEAERAALLAERENWSAAQLQLGDIARWFETVAVNLDNLDYAGKRLALEALGVETHVFAKDHAPRYEIKARIALRDTIVSTLTRCPSTCEPGMRRNMVTASTTGWS